MWQGFTRAESEGAAALAAERRRSADELAAMQAAGAQQYQRVVNSISDRYVRDMDAQVCGVAGAIQDPVQRS